MSSKHGGRRPGSGRPKGSKNALPLGAVKAIKAAGLRVPESATQDERELADESLDAMTKVMRGEVYFKDAPHRLKAAAQLREEICGPVKQRIEHSFNEMTDEQLEERKSELLTAWTASGTKPPEGN